MKSCRFYSRLALLATVFPVFAGGLHAESPISFAPPTLQELGKKTSALLDPAETIEADGSIALTDGSSYYIFSKGGDFFSGPIGESGRTLEGRWSQPDKGRFVVTAKRGWLNGLAGETYHRITFSIGAGEKKPLRAERIPAIMEFAAYFLIQEFVEIPAPEKK